MEICTGGEVFDVIQDGPGRLPERAVSRMMKQLLVAVAYLHTNGIAHRDLKPENILFASKDKDSPVKIKLIVGRRRRRRRELFGRSSSCGVVIVVVVVLVAPSPLGLVGSNR